MTHDTLASKLCAMLNIKTSSGNAVTTLFRAENAVEFTLPARVQALLGRRRELTVSAPTGDEMLNQLNKWLVLHTVGNWSHWGLLTKVTVVIPAERHRLTIVDVPGFGAEGVNSFRESIVKEVVSNCECSTLLICLAPKRFDTNNYPTAKILRDTRVFEQLLGNKLNRKVGEVITMTSLDSNDSKGQKVEKASKKLDLRGQNQAERVLKTHQVTPGHLVEFAQEKCDTAATWLKQNFKETVSTSEEHVKKFPNHVKDEDVDSVFERFCHSKVVDVRGSVEEMLNKASSKLPDDLTLNAVVDALVENSEDSLRRKRLLCLQRLLHKCLIPFYNEHAMVSGLRHFNPEGINAEKIPTRSQLMMAVRGNVAGVLMGFDMHAERETRSTISRKRTGYLGEEEIRAVLDSLAELSTPEDVRARWDEDRFEQYRRPHSRLLGRVLMSLNKPNADIEDLADIVMPEMANCSVVSLWAELRNLKPKLIKEPIAEMKKVLEDLFNQPLENNNSNNEENLKKLLALVVHELCKRCDEAGSKCNILYEDLLKKLPGTQASC